MTPVEQMREGAAEIADKWATELQRRHGNGGPAADIRRIPLPVDATEPSDKIARMKAALGVAENALASWSCTCRNHTCSERGRLQPVIEAQSECPRLFTRQALTAIREALGETEPTL